MTRETLKKKLASSRVNVSSEALDRLDTREVLALIRLGEKSGTYINVGTTSPGFTIEENYG